jgi:hypothetical protein
MHREEGGAHRRDRQRCPLDRGADIEKLSVDEHRSGVMRKLARERKPA